MISSVNALPINRVRGHGTPACNPHGIVPVPAQNLVRLRVWAFAGNTFKAIEGVEHLLPTAKSNQIIQCQGRPFVVGAHGTAVRAVRAGSGRVLQDKARIQYSVARRPHACISIFAFASKNPPPPSPRQRFVNFAHHRLGRSQSFVALILPFGRADFRWIRRHVQIRFELPHQLVDVAAEVVEIDF